MRTASSGPGSASSRVRYGGAGRHTYPFPRRREGAQHGAETLLTCFSDIGGLISYIKLYGNITSSTTTVLVFKLSCTYS